MVSMCLSILRLFSLSFACSLDISIFVSSFISAAATVVVAFPLHRHRVHWSRNCFVAALSPTQFFFSLSPSFIFVKLYIHHAVAALSKYDGCDSMQISMKRFMYKTWTISKRLEFFLRVLLLIASFIPHLVLYVSDWDHAIRIQPLTSPIASP